jgi:hypothetical protein
MEVTGCKAWAVWWMDNMFSVKLVQKFSCDRSCTWKFLCEQARSFHSGNFLQVPLCWSVMGCVHFLLWSRNKDENVLLIPKIKHKLQGPELLSIVGDQMWYVFTPQMPPSLSELSTDSTTSNYMTDELWD